MSKNYTLTSNIGITHVRPWPEKKIELAKTDAEIMAETREYIEKNGWWKGAMLGPNGRQVCGAGGLMYSQGWVWKGIITIPEEYQEDANRILGKVAKAIGLRVHSQNTTGFVQWNDNIAKTKQEVLDAFAKAEKIELAGFDPDAP
jgi:hypothetical protein